MTETPKADRPGPSGRTLGSMRGRMVVQADFDSPLPQNVLADFEGVASDALPALETGKESEPGSQSKR